MSAADTNTRIMPPTAMDREAISRGQIPDFRPQPRRPYVPRHLHPEDHDTTIISADQIAAVCAPVVSKPVPVPVPIPDPPPADEQMRTLAGLLRNLRTPRRRL